MRAPEPEVQEPVAQIHHLFVKIFRGIIDDVFIPVQFRQHLPVRSILPDTAEHLPDALVVAVLQQGSGLKLPLGYVFFHSQRISFSFSFSFAMTVSATWIHRFWKSTSCAGVIIFVCTS